MDEKQEILNNYNLLVYNLNRLQYLSIYLKWIIDNTIDRDTDSDEFIYIYRKVEEMALLYGIQNDVVHRFKNEITKMLNISDIKSELNLLEYLETIKEEIIEIHKSKSA